MVNTDLCRCRKDDIKNRRVGFIEPSNGSLNGMLRFDMDCPIHGVATLRVNGVYDDSILRARLDDIEEISSETTTGVWEDDFISGLGDFYDFVSNAILADPETPLRVLLDDLYSMEPLEEDSSFLSGWHCARDHCVTSLREALS